jgi:hypothetical protein
MTMKRHIALEAAGYFVVACAGLISAYRLRPIGILFVWLLPLAYVLLTRPQLPTCAIASMLVAIAAALGHGYTSAGYDSSQWDGTHMTFGLIEATIQAAICLPATALLANRRRRMQERTHVG